MYCVKVSKHSVRSLINTRGLHLIPFQSWRSNSLAVMMRRLWVTDKPDLYMEELKAFMTTLTEVEVRTTYIRSGG